MTTTHAYSFVTLRADYFRAFVGGAICLMPYVMGAEIVGAVSILLGGAVLFAIFGWRTYLRQIRQITLDENLISMKGRGNHMGNHILPWDKLSDLSLAYFSTWQSGGKGWMQLRLQGAGQTIRIESSLADFETVLRRAVEAAAVNNLTMSSATLRNLAAFNVALPSAGQSVRLDHE